MGLIIGLIGANIIANKIGDKCIEYAKTRSEARIQEAKINSQSAESIARTTYSGLTDIEGIKSRAKIITAAMQNGMISNPHSIDVSNNTTPQVMYCSQCGQKLDQDAVFCKYCGTKIWQ